MAVSTAKSSLLRSSAKFSRTCSADDNRASLWRADSGRRKDPRLPPDGAVDAPAETASAEVGEQTTGKGTGGSVEEEDDEEEVGEEKQEEGERDAKGNDAMIVPCCLGECTSCFASA